MKNNWKIIILCLWVIFSFLSITSGYSQKIITHKNDTLVAITPKQLSTINGIIADYEITKKTLILNQNLVKLDSVSILNRDSIIVNLKRSVKTQEDFIDTQKNSMLQLNKELSRMKRKNKLKNSIIITAIAATLGVLILK